jgi:hypothetical protein
MSQTGCIEEITPLYVKVNGQSIRYKSVYEVQNFRAGDIISYETEEQPSKNDPEMSLTWFKQGTFRHADSPKPDEAFVTGDKVIRNSKLEGVQVVEDYDPKKHAHLPHKEEPKKPKDDEPEHHPGVKDVVDFMSVSYPKQPPHKDILIVRQTCLQRAVELGCTRDEVITTAAMLEEWVLR